MEPEVRGCSSLLLKWPIMRVIQHLGVQTSGPSYLEILEMIIKHYHSYTRSIIYIQPFVVEYSFNIVFSGVDGMLT
jgi:hypothetical protein